ncbi:ornithine cyclodeaminase family protein [Paracoccus saliphilus]|uniref:Ornithine cyclodeaminase n=1 Tax=Paracoccus saliphilus TaxID=405559 RepID=A0AA46A700_9RHOB|nr:ornithine cyclodeaminase [Paracoccus saliphilus]WCR03856.1 ornithine cyclodeaminase [Paracoccus saliphilus]SIT05454.1 ornithine cyclodeaminase [Paracoccus saliphilus]
MQPVILNYEEMLPKLSWQEAVEALRKGHELPKADMEDLLLGPSGSCLLNRAARIEGLGFGVKAETVMEGNAGRNLPSIQGSVIVFDPDTGAVRAVIESRLVTEFKTASDSVLGACLLARPESRHLVIVGAGAMAACLARAYTALFPKLDRISIWARRIDRAQLLVSNLDGLGPELVSVSSLRDAVQEADIVTAATMARQPIIFGEWIRPGTHVDLVGSFTPEMREADDSLIAASRLFADCRQTTLEQVGDLIQPISSGAITRQHLIGDLYDIIAKDAPGRLSDTDITVFKNGGGAHLDLMIADYIAKVSTRSEMSVSAE